MFSAIYTGHAQHTSYLIALSWFPWVVWRLDTALLQRRFWPAVQAGALWGLSALGGYPGLIVAGGLYAGLWSIGRILCTPPEPEQRTSYLGRTGTLIKSLAGFAATGLVVVAPLYAGFLIEGRGYSDRAGALPRDVAVNSNALHPASLATLASPAACVQVAASSRPLWETDCSMASLYVSPLLLVLACAIGQGSCEREFRWYLVGLAGLYLATALGGWLPVRGWLYDLVPPARYFRCSALFRCQAIFTLIVLALFAGRDLADPAAREAAWNRVRRGARWLAIPAVVAFAVVCLLSPGKGWAGLAALGAVHLAVVWAAILWLCRKHPTADALPYRLLIALAIADAAFTVAISKPTMYGNRKEWKKLNAERVASVDLTARGLDRQLSDKALRPDPLNSNLPLKVPVLSSYTPFLNQLHRRYAEHPALAATAIGPDRIWFSPLATMVEADEAAVARLERIADKLGRPCLVVNEVDGGTRGKLLGSGDPNVDRRDAGPTVSQVHAGPPEDLPPMQPIPASVVEYTPNRLVLDVTAPDSGWLLVTDRWASGWRATVDGRPVPLFIGNLVFRTVAMTPGPHRIAFDYRPFGYPWLLVASWSTLAITLAGPAVCRRLLIKKEESLTPEGTRSWTTARS
jgi:hypothetical protein